MLWCCIRDDGSPAVSSCCYDSIHIPNLPVWQMVYLISHNDLTFRAPLPPLCYTVQKKADGYDPKKSKVSEDKMDEWRSATLTGDLSEVPGIGPATIKKLAESDEGQDKITNTYQLFGKFLMLKGPGHGDEIMVQPIEHTQKFWEFLKNRGIASHRSAIVRAIAEKSATFFNDIYDANDYEDDDEE